VAPAERRRRRAGVAVDFAPMSESRNSRAAVVAAAFALALAAPAGAEDDKKPPSLLGPATREQLEAAEPSWVEAEIEAAPDPGAAQALAAVPPGAEVTVYLGTWCSDSRRELARLWRALDEAGGEPSFAIEYIAVDRSDKRPPELERELDLRYVPTFIVRRGGAEVGRVVEESPGGIERDLLALLTGEASGVISARDDVGAPAGQDDPGARPAADAGVPDPPPAPAGGGERAPGR